MSDKEDNALAISSFTCTGEKGREGERVGEREREGGEIKGERERGSEKEGGGRDMTYVLNCESVNARPEV